jgi:hypothetical protein
MMNNENNYEEKQDKDEGEIFIYLF